MALTAPTGGNAARQIAPEGLYPARCYQIIDLGTSEQGVISPAKSEKFNSYLNCQPRKRYLTMTKANSRTMFAASTR